MLQWASGIFEKKKKANSLETGVDTNPETHFGHSKSFLPVIAGGRGSLWDFPPATS
jgi:hypothetical protein